MKFPHRGHLRRDKKTESRLAVKREHLYTQEPLLANARRVQGLL